MNDHPRAPQPTDPERSEPLPREGHAQALDASRAWKAFLAHMRHELRTPLNAMLGYTEMLLEDAAEQNQQDWIPDLHKMHAASNQLLGRVNELLDPVRVEAAQSQVGLEAFGATLHHELRTPITAIVGYSELLLEVAAERGQEGSAPDLHKIHAAAQRFLGLLNDLVNASAVKTDGQDPDRHTPDPPTALQEASPASRPPGRESLAHEQTGSLLIVDDQEMNRDMLSRRFQRRGYIVAVAADGQQALAMIEAQRFDLVLLDIMMPGMSGLELLKILRERSSAAELPVIMATAIDQSRDIVEALTLGANDYVTKPLDFPVVLARTQTQLSLKRAREEIERLARQLELRNRFIRDTFGRYLTDEVVASLLDSPEGLRLGGEQRKVTIVMSDLRGFTSLSGRLAPEQVVAIVNRYLGAMVEVILPYQGTIIEFIGDAIFVLFGAPIWRADDAERAVACAVAMQLAMASVNEQNRREGLPAVEMGIGVHTGDVVVGNIGSHKRTKYGVVGSHVNLTARIESYTVGGQILISEATRREVGPTLTIREQMVVEAKGVEQPIILYDLEGIGGAYHLFLPERAVAFVTLAEEIPIRYSILEGADAGRAVFTGSFVKLSATGAEVRADHPVAPLSDLKIRLTGTSGEEIPGDLYAKVVGKPTDTRFTVRFTSIPPAVATFLRGTIQ